MTTLFCDVGGVLIHNPWIETAEALSTRYKVDRNEAFAQLSRLSLQLDKDLVTLRQYHSLLNDALQLDTPFRYFMRVLRSASGRIPPVWGAVQAIHDSGSIEVVALSNMSREVWASLQKRFDIGSLFHSTVLSYELGVLKPDPSIFRIALRQAGVPPRECVFVDDTLANVRAAKSLGLGTYQAQHPAGTAAFLRSLIGDGH